jgi:hypothetical protein
MMADVVIKWFYEDTDFKKYKGYRLIGIDGTVMEINNFEKLRSEFGYIETQLPPTESRWVVFRTKSPVSTKAY